MLPGIWDFFISVRLTIVLLILLSIVCIIGTIVPQNASLDQYLRVYDKSTYQLLKAAGFLDLYHAWWFTLLMGVFTVNLIACSVNRLPGIARFLHRSSPVLDDSLLKGLTCEKRFKLKQYGQDTRQHFENALQNFLKKPDTATGAGAEHFLAERGRLSRFAFYCTHLGVVVIIAGAMLGGLGFQGYMQLFEGQKSGNVILRETRAQHDLGFEVRCDKFEISYYDEKQMPKDYKSALTVLEGGKEVLTKVIEVNDPLIYRGVYFYQSSYGTGTDTGGDVLLEVTEKNTGTRRKYRGKIGTRFQVEGTEDEIRIDRLVPDFSMDDSGNVFSRSQQPNNPAILLSVYPREKDTYSTWVFAKFPTFHKKPDHPYDISFLKMFPRYYTGLQVAKDPGVWTVWVGCFLMLAGIYLVFFTVHRRIWLRVEKKDDQYEVVLAGSSNRNKEEFAENFNKLFEQIKSIGKKT